MKIKIIKCLNDNYSYILIDSKKNVCVVDPSESDPIIKTIDKNKFKLQFVLNTHHHFDHIGGNLDLKNKYKCKIIGFENDKDRIPGIDIFLKNNDIWKSGEFEAKIIHVPGHTSGHVCYSFYNNNLVFTGDTLFALGCGRIFEGTHKEMYESLSILKKLPETTKIYCGHEYTYNNSKFCLKYDKDNINLKKMILKIERKLKKNIPTIPTTIKDELACNIFLRAKSLKEFSKLRDLKDNF
tara:strand:+ start:285 stop:1001 length:717 start_codon:yes stop_codon:yes gene_type:complete